MDSQEYRAILEKVGIRQASFGRALGYGKDSPSLWGTGRNPIPAPVSVVLRALAADKITVADVEAWAK